MVKLRAEYRFQFLIKSLSRKSVAQLLSRARQFAEEQGWPATALVIDVDPFDFN
jgi:primosomal protein N'